MDHQETPQERTQDEEPTFSQVVDAAGSTTKTNRLLDGEVLPAISPPACAPVLVSRLRVTLRRMFFFGSVIVVNLIAVLWMADLFYRQGFHNSHYLILAIFALLNGLLVLGSFHALAGVWDWLFSWRTVRITRLTEKQVNPLCHRYAVVMPVYNEDIVKVCARVEAIYL
jgi:membrane glycosyltransferase